MLSVPIISSFNDKGIKNAIKKFKELETTGQKAQFAIKKAAVPAAAALAGLGGFLISAAKGAEDARRANQKLGAVLDTMGYAKATDRVSAYAESLEKTIAVDADVIKATQTKLATFSQLTKSVGEAGGAFDRATMAALDMAAAGFGTAEGNAVQLGKALQNPIKGIAALAKSGIDFTDKEKEKIKALTESGKLLEAQDMVLKAIEKQVGNTAKESASSFEKMKFALAGVSDSIGDMLLPIIDDIAPKLAAFSEWAQKNPGLMKLAVLGIGGLTAAVIALNIAMSLNPISLIVIGIGLLIGLLAAAYIKFEGFRKVVDNVFGAIKWWITNVSIPLFKTLMSTVKFVFNGIAKLWNNTIGKIEIKIPDIKGLPGRGKTFSVPKIPMLADGGIIKASTGGTLALIGEGGQDEAVIPLSKMGNMGGNTFVIQTGVGDPIAIGREIERIMQRYQRRTGVAA
jgi:hypothetical protein